MVTVAVAGGTNGIGANIVREILATKKHDAIVLSRSARPELEKQGAIVRVVDYTSPESLAAALRGVHTVISCISSYGPDLATSQLALLDAARAVGASRFVPSDFAVDVYEEIHGYAPKAVVWKAVQTSGLEYTRFITGLWLNLLGAGAPRDEVEARAGYQGPAFLVDLKAGTALLPGDPEAPPAVVFTHMRDVARFVAASLDLERWDPDSRVWGERMTLAEVVSVAEQITGRRVRVENVGLAQIEEALKTEKAENPGSMALMVHEFRLAVGKGRYDFQPSLNAKFPEIKPVGVREYLQKYWGTN